MEGKDAKKMDSESPFRLSSGCLFVDVGGLSDDGMLCFRPGIEHAPGGVLPPYKSHKGAVSVSFGNDGLAYLSGIWVAERPAYRKRSIS